MNQTELHQTLQRLHAQLQRPGAVDDRTRDLLRALSSDIEQVLEAPDEAAARERSASLRGRLEEAVQHFEAAHPDLARTTTNLLDTLALYNL